MSAVAAGSVMRSDRSGDEGRRVQGRLIFAGIPARPTRVRAHGTAQQDTGTNRATATGTGSRRTRGKTARGGMLTAARWAWPAAATTTRSARTRTTARRRCLEVADRRRRQLHRGADPRAALRPAAGEGRLHGRLQARGQPAIYAKSLISGEIDVVPEYAATMAEYLNRQKNGPTPPRSPPPTRRRR